MRPSTRPLPCLAGGAQPSCSAAAAGAAVPHASTWGSHAAAAAVGVGCAPIGPSWWCPACCCSWGALGPKAAEAALLLLLVVLRLWREASAAVGRLHEGPLLLLLLGLQAAPLLMLMLLLPWMLLLLLLSVVRPLLVLAGRGFLLPAWLWHV